jgi:hypothetical protein
MLVEKGLRLALLLLVLGVGADYADNPLAADDLAILTNAPDAASDLHDGVPS